MVVDELDRSRDGALSDGNLGGCGRLGPFLIDPDHGLVPDFADIEAFAAHLVEA